MYKMKFHKLLFFFFYFSYSQIIDQPDGFTYAVVVFWITDINNVFINLFNGSIDDFTADSICSDNIMQRRRKKGKK